MIGGSICLKGSEYYGAWVVVPAGGNQALHQRKHSYERQSNRPIIHPETILVLYVDSMAPAKTGGFHSLHQSL